MKAQQAVITANAAKYGQSVKSIVKNAKQEAAAREAAAKTQAKAYSMLGGRIGSLRNRMLEYKDVLGQEGGKEALLKAGLAGAAEGAVALSSAAVLAGAAVGVALATGIAAATVSLTKWVVLTASARAQTRLQMEAWVRTSDNARNLADQVDALSMKVPTSTEALSKMAIGLREAGIRGEPLVDSLNAIGQASSALGDQAGAKLQDFITRYQRMGVMQINPLEMLGTGLDFDDVAGALAKNMGASIEKARAALATGQVKLGDGAKAMRKAVEDKFAGLNIRKLSDIGGAAEQIGKRLGALTKDVDLEPVTRFLDRIFKDLDGSSVVGQALKTTFESFATAFGSTLDKNGDWIQYGLQSALLWTIELATEVIIFKNKVEDAFNDGRSAAEKFNAILDTIKGSLKLVGGLAIAAVDPIHGIKWAFEGASTLNDVANRPSGPGAPTPAGPPLPPHASGGVVTGISGGVATTAPLPATGEGLVSIGMGEAIVPASQVRAGGGGGAVFHFGDIVVQSSEAEPAAVAREVLDSITERILDALERSHAQLGVRG